MAATVAVAATDATEAACVMFSQFCLRGIGIKCLIFLPRQMRQKRMQPNVY